MILSVVYGGVKIRVVTNNLSPQGRAYTRALKIEGSLSPPIPVGGGAVDTNDWFISRVDNSVDPDQLASQEPADLDLHCFQNRIYPALAYNYIVRVSH